MRNGPALRYSSRPFGRSDPSKRPLDVLIRPGANRSFTIRRSKSPFRDFSCVMRITPRCHARISSVWPLIKERSPRAEGRRSGSGRGMPCLPSVKVWRGFPRPPAISVPVRSASPQLTMPAFAPTPADGLQRSSSARGPYYPQGNPWTEPPRAVAYVEQPPEAPIPSHTSTVATGVPMEGTAAEYDAGARDGDKFRRKITRNTLASSSSGKWSEAERDQGLHA